MRPSIIINFAVKRIMAALSMALRSFANHQSWWIGVCLFSTRNDGIVGRIMNFHDNRDDRLLSFKVFRWNFLSFFRVAKVKPSIDFLTNETFDNLTNVSLQPDVESSRVNWNGSTNDSRVFVRTLRSCLLDKLVLVFSKLYFEIIKKRKK